jgi:hypothetical protein
MLLFQRNSLNYVGLQCDSCADARDAGMLEDLRELGWRVGREDTGDDLCPQCNPGYPIGTARGRRDTERVGEDAVSPSALHQDWSGDQEPPSEDDSSAPLRLKLVGGRSD